MFFLCFVARLHTEVTVPYIGASVSQSQIQSLVVFTHSQLGIAKKIYTILNTAPSNFEERDSKVSDTNVRNYSLQQLCSSQILSVRVILNPLFLFFDVHANTISFFMYRAQDELYVT